MDGAQEPLLRGIHPAGDACRYPARCARVAGGTARVGDHDRRRLGQEEHPHCLDRLHLWDFVDGVSDGYSVQRQKPAPDLFLHCVRQLGVDPSEAIVVEDAASGVEAALAGGFWTVGLGPRERVGAAHAVFPSLEGITLRAILDALAQAAVV